MDRGNQLCECPFGFGGDYCEIGMFTVSSVNFAVVLNFVSYPYYRYVRWVCGTKTLLNLNCIGKCLLELEECDPNPCPNSDSCVQLKKEVEKTSKTVVELFSTPTFFKCQCQPGWMGLFCESEFIFVLFCFVALRYGPIK